jgi:hypothetical protein
MEIYWISGSPFAWRVLLTAEVKGIPYEGKLLEASKGELKTPEFLAIENSSPMARRRQYFRCSSLLRHEEQARISQEHLAIRLLRIGSR